MEMTCIAAVLAGSVAGGQLIDGLTVALGNSWTASLAAFLVLAAGCVLALVGFHRVPAQPAATREPFSGQALWGHWSLLRTLRHDRAVWRAALGDAVFYLAGGVLLLTLTQAGRHLHPDGIGAARATGLFLALIGLGVAVGSVAAARLCRQRVQTGLAPIGAFGMAVFLVMAAVPPVGSPAFGAALVGVGIFGGLFLVPLGALMVDRAAENERGRVLAASGLLSSVAGVAAVALHALADQVFGLSVSGQLLLLAALFLVTAFAAVCFVPDALLRTVALVVARLRYRVTRVGNLPESGGALIVCNHVSYVDTLALSLASPRPIRFLSYEGFFRTPVLGPLLRIFGAIPVSPTRAKDAIVRAAEHIRAGELVCIFPEGQLTRTGCLMEIKSGFELIARRAGCPVIVAHLDGLWGSIHSFAGGRYFTKWPQGLSRTVTVSFSRPLGDVSANAVRETLLTLGAAALAERAGRTTLATALVRALESAPFRVAVADADGKTLRSGPLLAAAWVLARRWRTAFPEDRVGVILPPGPAGALANLALVLAGKIPVNLNPTLGPEAARACNEQAGIRRIVTAGAVRGKIPSFPWTDDVVQIEEAVRSVGPVERFLALGQIVALPGPLLRRRLLGTPRPAADEAVLLFTSGTSGRPKGVPLTSANILGNLAQITETGFLRHDDRLCSALPLFHSFGLTMGLFFPLLAGRTVVTAPSPLDSGALAAACRLHAPTVLLGTPTFLRGYLKRVPRDAFGTLRLAVTGAERLPEETAQAFRERFGCEILEGYGLTEAAPVVSLNLPAPACGPGAETIQTGSRPGSVGRLVPGLACRFVDPETGAPAANRGLLALRGVNLIRGYLDGSAPEKFSDGWYHTGDIARLDAEGFLFLEGRASRFSKVAGEMVSHAAVEDALCTALAGDGQDCVLGLPCAEKGERLVVLTTRTVGADTLRQALKSRLPNLWIPREVIRVDALPCLASGKLDLAQCRRLATMEEARA
jgi:acyl-[acyl-carrier-protein]-phospholipid O-acyltransferase/long-chain-fatty-acid--[acyl-carrier-protein] ligase